MTEAKSPGADAATEVDHIGTAHGKHSLGEKNFGLKFEYDFADGGLAGVDYPVGKTIPEGLVFTHGLVESVEITAPNPATFEIYSGGSAIATGAVGVATFGSVTNPMPAGFGAPVVAPAGEVTVRPLGAPITSGKVRVHLFYEVL